MERRTHNWRFGWRLVLTPTRALFDSPFIKAQPRWDIKRWTRTFLLLNVIMLFVLKPLWECESWTGRFVVLLILYLVPMSRVIEILYAFYYDALEKLDPEGYRPSQLKRGDRFRLLGLSYIEISVCFATAFHVMPRPWFNVPLGATHSGVLLGPLDWLYFSWITITTAGYGDFYPIHPVARAVVMAELAIGLFLIIFAVGSYFAYKEELDQKGMSNQQVDL